MKVSGRTVTLEFLRDPIRVALHGRKFTSIPSEQVEEISLEEQKGRVESSS